MMDRITVRLPRDLMRLAKRKAAEEGRKVCAFRKDSVLLAIEWGCEWITLDRGYARFPGLKWRTPEASQRPRQ